MGGDVGFNKYQAKTVWFFPLPWSTVFVAAGQWGLIKQKGGEKLPVFHKYRIGGINTVRGFNDYSISPKDPVTGDRIGGEKAMVYNLEYRFPVYKKQGIVGLLFFDAGNVFTDNESFTFSGIRKSVGVGINWYSPVGPLRIEYGRNLDPQWDERSGEYHFSIGGMF